MHPFNYHAECHDQLSELCIRNGSMTTWEIFVIHSPLAFSHFAKHSLPCSFLHKGFTPEALAGWKCWFVWTLNCWFILAYSAFPFTTLLSRKIVSHICVCAFEDIWAFLVFKWSWHFQVQSFQKHSKAQSQYETLMLKLFFLSIRVSLPLSMFNVLTHRWHSY